MLDKEIYSELLLIRTEKLALKDGSSKQGKAIRALVGSKWVEAKVLKQDTSFIDIWILYCVWKQYVCVSLLWNTLPDLSCTGFVGALIETIEALCKLRPKLNIQEVHLPTAEHSGREYTYLLMGRIVKNW